MRKGYFLLFLLIMSVFLSLYLVGSTVISYNRIFPANESWTRINDTTLSFYFNATGDNETTFQCLLFVDDIGFGNETVNNDTYSFIMANASLQDGYNHSWYINCTDNETTTTGIYLLNVDTLAPTSNITSSPTNGSLIPSTTPTIKINQTDNLDEILDYILFVDGVSMNVSTALNSTEATIELSTLGEGPHRVEAQATDNAGNMINSSSIFFTVDSIAPTADIESPANLTWTNDITPDIVINTTDGADSIMNITVWVDGILNNESQVDNSTHFTITLATLAEGNHSIHIRSEDDIGTSTNSSVLWIQVDAGLPVVNITSSPTNGSTIAANNPSIAFNITDNQDELINYTVIVDGSAVNSSEIANSTIESINLAALSDGLHYLVVEALDEAGNRFNSTPVQFFTVDTTLPVVNITSAPTNGSTIPANNPTIMFNITDNIDATINYTVIVDGLPLNSSSMTNSTEETINLAALSDGLHYLVVEALDEAGWRFNSTPVIYFTVDSVPPVVNITSAPINGSTIAANNPSIAFNITDNQDELINYTVIVDGSAVNSSEIANSTIESINLAALSDGLHYLVVEVFDEAGNRFNSTPVQFFTVDTAPPLQNMQPVLRGDLDGYFVVGDYFNMSVNFTDVTGATQNVTFNMSSICDDFVVTKTAIESDYWQANCTVDINVDFSPVNITYLFCDTVGNCNSSFYTVVLFNFTYPSDVDGILTFYHDQTTDLTTESNLNDVPFTLELNINGATLPGQPWIGFKNALRLNFSSIDFTDPQAQTDLQNLATAINITIRNPKNGEYGGSRIYVDTGAFAALDTDATIRLSYLPFTGLEAANLMNDTGGSDSISGVRYVSNLDGTGNLTFTVTGFSGYNVTDSALPEITINSPLNNTYSQALYLNFTFNGTGTEIDNTTVNVTLTVAGIDIYYAFENFTCVASDNYQVQECYQLMAGLPDGVYTIAASANDYGGASGNFAIVSGENITLDTTSPTVSSLNAPTNASYLNYTTVTFNFTAYDNLDTFLAYTLYLDGAANETGVMANGTAANFTLVVSEARHNWTIGVTDDSGKTANYTGQFNFYADTTAPTTSSNEPTGWQTTAFNVILTPADTVAGVYYTTYLYDGAASNGTNVSVTTSGNHTIAYYSVDYSGNVESTLTVYAALDVVNPVVSSLNAPANGSQQLPDVVFNFTAYDDIDTNLSYTLFLNSTANVTGYAPNNTATVFSVNFPEGADYYWTIQVADDSGRAANFSGNYVFSIYEFAPTSAPILDASGVNDTDSDGNIEIGWAADANATYYRVYRQSTNITNATDADLLATIAAPTTQFQDNTSVNGTTYWYAVTSVDSALNENKTIVSASFSVTSNDTILPKLPLNTGATTNTDGSVTVSWNAVTQDINNNSDTIIVYRVWKTTNLTGLNLSADAENVSDTLSTSYTDTSITTGTNYTYIITAIDDGSNHNNTRSDSNTISIEPSACSNSYTYSSWSTCSSSTQSRTGTRTCYGGGANSTTGSQSCTSESSGSSSSSSPSTSTTPSNPVQVHMWQLLSKGTSTIMSITNPNLGITELVIGLKEDVKNARLSVEALSDKPSGTPNFIGRVYKYLKIDKGTITDSSLIGAKIKFKVEKSWLSENGILAQNIVLKRLTANWYDLPTKKSSEDGNYIYYEADTPGFSFFIIGVNPSIEQINAPEPVQQEIIEPQPEVIEETTPAVAAPEENNAPLPVPVAVRKTGNPALLIIAIIAGLLGIYLFAINRKSEKVEKKDHIDKSIRELETKLKDIEQVHKKKKL